MGISSPCPKQLPAYMETKNIRQGLAPGGRREIVKKGLFGGTGKKIALSKWLQCPEEGNYIPIYMNKYKAEKYWAENLRFEEFHSTKREKQKLQKDYQVV
jgi:hypothetical protein